MEKDEWKGKTEREAVIIQTSMVGIAANILLALFKGLVGLASNSIAMVLDAVNNLSDVLSSVVTIVGARLAGRAPDKKHPLGHGRIEYLSAMIVAAIVLYAGITALVESVKSLIQPRQPAYTPLSLGVMTAAIAVKLLLGRYVKRQGKLAHSGALVASGSDASFDAVLSASVLGSALLYLGRGIQLDALVGIAISVFIIRAGYEMISDSVDDILGVRVSAGLSRRIKELVGEDPEVLGVYDLLLNNYGPERYLGSLHVEVRDGMTACEIDTMARRIQQRVFEAQGVILTTVGIYAQNTGSDEAARLRTEISRRVMSHEGVLQLHGFYAELNERIIKFDLIIDFDLKDGITREELYQEIYEELQKAYPDYHITMTLDSDVSD